MIQDYLHLYLGCEVYDNFNDVVMKLTPMSYAGYMQPRWHKEEDSQIKPLLRPLSSMTEVESEQAISIWVNNEYDKIGLMYATGQVAKYLLSKHFDLFGLIESGEALNATKFKIK